MNKQNTNIALFALLAGILLLAACKPAAQQTPTNDPNVVITEAAMTVAVKLTETAASRPALPATETPAPVLPTTAPTVTIAPPPAQPAAAATNTTAPTVAPPSSSTSPDNASFVDDVTVPDGTAAQPGATFLKTWRIKNTGTTTWSSAYALVWVDGDKMSSPDSVSLPNEVRPGETVDISVNLTAPTKAGTYQTYFRLRNASGQLFKLDGTGDLWVKIIVGLPSTITPTGTAEPEPQPTATSTTSS